jgi:hypothetical protein
MTPRQLTSQYHDFKIDLISLDEPNYGRVLWKVKLTFNGQDLTQQLLGQWNYIHDISDNKLNVDSLEGNSIYIPAELNSIIFQPEHFKTHKILAKSNSIERYIGNIFGRKRLIELYSKTIIVTDLLSLKSQIIPADDDKRIEWAKVTSDDKIEISFRQVEIKGVTENIKARGTQIIDE